MEPSQDPSYAEEITYRRDVHVGAHEPTLDQMAHSLEEFKDTIHNRIWPWRRVLNRIAHFTTDLNSKLAEFGDYTLEEDSQHGLQSAASAGSATWTEQGGVEERGVLGYDCPECQFEDVTYSAVNQMGSADNIVESNERFANPTFAQRLTPNVPSSPSGDARTALSDLRHHVEQLDAALNRTIGALGAVSYSLGDFSTRLEAIGRQNEDDGFTPIAATRSIGYWGNRQARVLGEGPDGQPIVYWSRSGDSGEDRGARLF